MKLKNMRIDEVSLVDKAANKRRFALLKRDLSKGAEEDAKAKADADAKAKADADAKAAADKLEADRKAAEKVKLEAEEAAKLAREAKDAADLKEAQETLQAAKDLVSLVNQL